MTEPTEAEIDINGQPLALAQSMTIRVALESFAAEIRKHLYRP